MPDILKQTQELATLSHPWNEHDLVPKDQQAACRKIGEELNAIGGMEAMQRAYNYAKSRNRCASVIQAYWDGVGEWRW